VVSTALSFFEFEDIEGYNSADKRDLLLEVLKENSVLLVLDNFETIPRPQKTAIVEFFEIDVKRALRRHPTNFKIIITSRELIPSGFHQIELTGLELREAKQLMAAWRREYSTSGPELTDSQKETLHKVSAGIPIVIKHCLGQIFEYNRPFSVVVDVIGGIESRRVVDFSFEEVLSLLREDQGQLAIVILLEVIACPLMLRQISDILERSEAEIGSKIPTLVNYQCIERVRAAGEEKYLVNEEIRLLTRRLSQDHAVMTQDIRSKITKNFTMEKQLSYTSEEQAVLSVFENYIREGNLLEGERFIQEEIGKRAHAVLLNFHYAKYLRTAKRDYTRAIEVLEVVREASNDHPSLLRLLIACYISQEIPNYARASAYVQQLERLASEDAEVRFEIGEFYARWSSSLKMSRDISPDPIKEMLRQQRYKELADQAIGYLERLPKPGHEIHYLLAQSYFNRWDYDRALQIMDKCVSLCQKSAPYYGSYLSFRKVILTQRDRRGRDREDGD
jgi:tetratricopeptide (TPR) repeat protein